MNDWDQRGTWTDVCALLRPCLPSRIPSDDTVVLKQREWDGGTLRDHTKRREEPQSASLYCAGMPLWRRFLKEEAHLFFLRGRYRHHKYAALTNLLNAKNPHGGFYSIQLGVYCFTHYELFHVHYALACIWLVDAVYCWMTLHCTEVSYSFWVTRRLIQAALVI